MTTAPSPAAVPQYARIANDLRAQIKDGTYGPGALLPSRNELTEMYGVSAITARDALSMISHEGYAKAIRGRRPHRPPQTLTPDAADPPLRWNRPRPGCAAVPAPARCLHQPPPDNIALPLETADPQVWVRRAVYIAADDRQPIQIHVSWLPGLTDAAASILHETDRPGSWPEAVQAITGRTIRAVRQLTRARNANLFDADTFGIPDRTTVLVAHATTYDTHHHPHRALPLHLAHRRRPHQRLPQLHTRRVSIESLFISLYGLCRLSLTSAGATFLLVTHGRITLSVTQGE